MNEETKLILEGIREILCLVGTPYQNNSFVRERLDNLTTRINQTLNPEETSLPDKTENALNSYQKKFGKKDKLKQKTKDALSEVEEKVEICEHCNITEINEEYPDGQNICGDCRGIIEVRDMEEDAKRGKRE
ncbi:hypothetical protein LCGC14_2677170 [marine sediment metagenome]|uniref:Uncharacterized protein n=1 Tax=marine sediment metagenome TaxID=412755 RepID=A0A0F8ZMG3_9ZZZZ